jgi:hypothetical protein
MPRFTLAYSFTPKFVRAVIGPDRVGAYALGNISGDFNAGYVGRSDRCLRERLAGHERLGEFAYFIVAPAQDVAAAFQSECALWHACIQSGHHLENRVHPAAPRTRGLVCPYCEFAEQAIRVLRVA